VREPLALLMLGVLGALVIVLANVLARRRGSLGSLSRQFTIGIGLAFGVTVVGVGVWLSLMIVVPTDLWRTTLALVYAGALASYVVWTFMRGVKHDLDAVRDRLEEVGAGRPPGSPVDVAGLDEVAELAASTNRMIEQLAEREAERDRADQARRDLVAAVSHDLRTPLTSLHLIAQAMEDGLLDDAARQRYSREMTVHVQSMSALVDDLFELSRLAAGAIEWTMRRVALDELVLETVDAMRTQADAGGVEVSAQVPADIGPAHANPEGVQRVLFNLIQNAIRHTPADGSVTVQAQAAGSSIEIEVADTGVGIDPSERERIFEPFFRGGDDRSRTTRGSGLGLAICRAIVEQHGGRIWLVPSEQGTRVRFSLPRASGGAPSRTPTGAGYL
jgi:signal transduction histidine kinase